MRNVLIFGGVVLCLTVIGFFLIALLIAGRSEDD